MNYLLLITDQQRHDTIAAAGYPHMHTPNLDRLATEGTLFTHAHSSNPICIPARHDLLTGVTARRHGFFSNGPGPIKDPSLPTLPRVLGEHGYHCGAIGKMHFKPAREHHGYHVLELMEETPAHIEDDEYARFIREAGHGATGALHGVRPLIYHEPQLAQLPDELHGTNWVADRSCRFIEANADRPFLLTASFIHPHPPLNIPENWQGHYSDADLPAPIPPRRESPYPECPDGHHAEADPAKHQRRIREAYFTAISMVDAAVGRIIEALRSSGQLDNTCILFTSDHGEMLQDHGLYQKACPYESAIRVPMIVRCPGRFAAGAREGRFVDLLDVFPTFLDLADIDYRANPAYANHSLAGKSLLAGASGEPDRGIQFVSTGKNGTRWVCARDRRFKYVYFFSGGTEWFFDLENDPDECNNLVGSPKLPVEAFERMKQACLAYELEWGESGSVVDEKFVTHDPWERTQPNARYAHFTNSQFPAINQTEGAAAQHLAEIRHALSMHEAPDALLANIPEDHRAGWIKGLLEIGGSREDAETLFPNPTKR